MQFKDPGDFVVVVVVLKFLKIPVFIIECKLQALLATPFTPH